MPRDAPLPQLGFRPTPRGHPLLEVQRITPDHLLHRLARHTHHHLELLYFEAPGGLHLTGPRLTPVEAGSLFAVAPGEAHDGRELGAALGWVVIFTPAAVEPHDPALQGFFRWWTHPLFPPFLRPAGVPNGVFRVPEEDRAAWSARLAELAGELREERPGFREAATALLRLLLVGAARLVDPRAQEAGPARAALVGRVFDLVDARFAEPLRLEDLAREVHRSPNHLADVVRAATGRSLKAWVTERRLAEARALLLAGIDVGDVAGRVGYADPTHFIRVFRRAHGLTPHAWRAAQAAGG